MKLGLQANIKKNVPTLAVFKKKKKKSEAPGDT